MAKVLDIVSRALRLLRVVDVNDVPESADVATAIDALNSMMQRWEANGLALGWSRVGAPDEELPVPPEAEEAVAYNLAVRLRPEYGNALDPDVIELARQFHSDLLRDCYTSAPLRLRQRAPGRGHYNIKTDEFH